MLIVGDSCTDGGRGCVDDGGETIVREVMGKAVVYDEQTRLSASTWYGRSRDVRYE